MKSIFKINNVYKIYIAQQLIFIFIIYYVIKNSPGPNILAVHGFIIYVLLLYFALLYAYKKYNDSIKISLFFWFMELLAITPLMIILMPYQCGKCYDVLSDNIFIIGHFSLLGLSGLVSIAYFKLLGYSKKYILKSIAYILAPIIAIAIWFLF